MPSPPSSAMTVAPSSSTALIKRPAPPETPDFGASRTPAFMPLSASTKSLIRRSSDTALMPPPPTKRIKRPPKVLDEDTYTSSLSTIIARDFFPGLLEAQHQKDYMDALDSQDPDWIADAQRRLTEVMNTPQRRRGTSLRTPVVRSRSTQIAPPASPGGIGGAAAQDPTTQDGKEVVNLDLSLSGFQARYTSEDNASFNDLLDSQNAKRREAYSFLWSANNKIPSGRAQAQQKVIAAREDEAARRKVLGIEDVKSLTVEDQRKAVPNSWTNKEPRNGLMFTPDSEHEPPRESDKEEEKKSKLPPKRVLYANTRLPPKHEDINGNERSDSPTSTAIADAIAGRPRAGSEAGFQGASTPRVGGYSFVDSEPSPIIHSSGPSPFSIAETPKREELLGRMVEKVARGKRKAERRRIGTPSMAESKNRVRTPAGERLWSMVKREGTGTGSGDVFGGAYATGSPRVKMEGRGKGFRWTPTPMAGRK